jgi:hypothetical protein
MATGEFAVSVLSGSPQDTRHHRSHPNAQRQQVREALDSVLWRFPRPRAGVRAASVCSTWVRRFSRPADCRSGMPRRAPPTRGAMPLPRSPGNRFAHTPSRRPPTPLHLGNCAGTAAPARRLGLSRSPADPRRHRRGHRAGPGQRRPIPVLATDDQHPGGHRTPLPIANKRWKLLKSSYGETA